MKQEGPLREALEKPPTGLAEIYNEMLGEKDPEDLKIVVRALTWLSYTKLPITVRELAVAAVFDPEYDLEARRLIHPDLILEICGSFVEMEPKTGVLGLSHASVRDFLDSPNLPDESPNEYYINPTTSIPLLLQNCLSYLQLPRFSRYMDECLEDLIKIDNDDTEDLPGKLSIALRTIENDDFFVFASWSWVAHAKESTDSNSEEAIFTFVTGENSRPFLLLCASLNSFGLTVGGWGHMSDYGRVRFKHRPLEEPFYWHPVRAHVPFRYRITPVYIAVGLGLRPVVRKLVQAGADLNIQGGLGQFPLNLAITLGREDLVEDLLEAGANPNCRSDFSLYEPPIAQAASLRNLTIVELLVRHGASLTNPDPRKAPLVVAFRSLLFIMEPDPKITRLLLGDVKDVGAVEALSISIEKGWLKSSRLLLQSLNEDSKFIIPPALLRLAAALGSIKTIKLLSEYGADFLTAPPGALLPLHLACEYQRYDVLEFFSKSVQSMEVETRNFIVGGRNVTPQILACRDDADLTNLCAYLTSYPMSPKQLSGLAYFLYKAGNRDMSLIFGPEAMRLEQSRSYKADTKQLEDLLRCDFCGLRVSERLWRCIDCRRSCCLDCYPPRHDRPCDPHLERKHDKYSNPKTVSTFIPGRYTRRRGRSQSPDRKVTKQPCPPRPPIARLRLRRDCVWVPIWQLQNTPSPRNTFKQKSESEEKWNEHLFSRFVSFFSINLTHM